MLTSIQVDEFCRGGHLTVEGVFSSEQVGAVLADADQWGNELLATMAPDEARWYLESESRADKPMLRKLDNPVFYRAAFRELASSPHLVAAVEQLIGSNVIAFFSQVFCKPPEIGGPKPVHQDNYYFGPEPVDAMLTVWVALDDATLENGCLLYGDGSHLRGLLPHTAPKDRPFDLQVAPLAMEGIAMTPTPVQRGGVSFHHGLTLHQSGRNTSTRPRRAVAIHYLHSNAKLVHPALAFDESFFVSIPT